MAGTRQEQTASIKNEVQHVAKLAKSAASGPGYTWSDLIGYHQGWTRGKTRDRIKRAEQQGLVRVIRRAGLPLVVFDAEEFHKSATRLFDGRRVMTKKIKW